MSKFKEFPKIGQFRHFVKDISHARGRGEIKDRFIQITGTVKLHGTNAGIGYDPVTQEVWAQKRSQVITSENDNFGFAKYVEDNKELLKASFADHCSEHLIEGIVIIYGEWAGKGIQKSVGISEIDKSFYAYGIFNNDVMYLDPFDLATLTYEFFEVPNFTSLENHSYTVDMDLDCPQLIGEQLEKITNSVEEECPVASSFGVKGIGEGVVWSYKTDKNETFMFKVKGDKHSVSKVKKMVSISPEILASINSFVDYSATENRFVQGLGEVGLEDKLVGKFIGWVNSDIHAEEQDTLLANNLDMKIVGKAIAHKSRAWYLDRLNKV